MNIFSTLKYLNDWAFKVDPQLPKHTTFWHPFFSFSSSIIATIVTSHHMAKIFEKKYPELKK